MKKMLLTLLTLLGASTTAKAEVVWFDGSHPVTYYIYGRAATVVDVAAQMFAEDMAAVTGMAAVADRQATIGIYQLDKNPSAAAGLRRLGVPVDDVARGFDAFWLGAVGGRLLVVGSNGRGAAYGLLELSRMAGVSPWVWWGDVVPERRQRLSVPDGFSRQHEPSVMYRGIFINDEDWSLREWSSLTFEPTGRKGSIGPRTYKEIFKLLLRLRANAVWPAMHEGTTGFFTVEGNKAVADSCGIVVGTSHCEPLLRNNVAEWDKAVRGDYNYMTNRRQVREYWAERLREARGAEALFTIGMRGIHDGSMEGVHTAEEKLHGLQLVIDEQRQLIARHYDRNVERVPQVFIPYKEVLQIMESGLRVPQDVTLMWCDDNYGYMTRLSDDEQQRRQGGAGVYYHLSYWGRPHDHLWLTTTQPGLICSEMRTAFTHNARRLWIANVHDPKVAAYDLELFLDMAWDIDAVTPQTVAAHLHRWLATQFGKPVADGIAPAMHELYRLNAIRKPEFMGWTQVELDKKKYPGGKSAPTVTQFTLQEACQRLADFGRIEATVDAYARMVPARLQDAYFAAVLYPVHASAAMSRKMLSDPVDSRRAYDEIQRLTDRYNQLNGGKWHRLMSAAPRSLPVFGQVRTELAVDTLGDGTHRIARDASQYTTATAGCEAVQMLGHSMNAVSIPKGGSLTYQFTPERDGHATLYTAMIPTQPNDKGDLRYSVQIDDQPPVVISLKEPFRSEQWKQNVLRGQALKQTPVRLTAGQHRLTITALDDHIICDQWMLDFADQRPFYVIPTKHQQTCPQ